MIWFTIAMFAVSFLATALLMPKPDLEDARASSLEDATFPRATEDAPYPLALGRVRLNAPNTLWYGDYKAVAITTKVKTGLFSSKRVTEGYKYYLGLDLGLVLGDKVQMVELWLDEESVWTGETSIDSVTEGGISAPELFGGYKSGGGFVSRFRFYPGSFDQPADPYVATHAGDAPAYRGLSRIVFYGGTVDETEITDFSSLIQRSLLGTFGSLTSFSSGLFGVGRIKSATGAYIGESNQLRTMGFTLQKYTNDLGAVNDGRVGDYDMNPMECLYQVIVSDWAGMGVPVEFIHTQSWLEAAETLYNEGNGMSVLVTSAQQGQTVVKEILRQCDAILYQDSETAQLRIKLIRNDYDVEELPVYDESDIIKIRSFTKTSWEDVVAQVKVSYAQRNVEGTAVAVAQDMATAGMIGRLKTSTISFPFCYDESLAAELAARELSQLSVPLFKMTLEMNRNGYSLRPGDVFVLDWDEYGLSNLVMRVQKHDLGELLNNKVVVDCVQDTFGISTAVLAPPQSTSWVPIVTRPVDIVTSEVTELPTFLARRLDNPVAEGYVQPMTFVNAPSSSSTDWSFVATLTSDLDPDYASPDMAEYMGNGTLTADYARDAGQLTGVDATGFTLTNVTGVVFEPGTEAQILAGEAGILYVDGEWMGFTGLVDNTTSVTLSGVYRGLFGSSPKDHASGARVYHPTTEHYTDGTIGADLQAGVPLYYKLLDAVGTNMRDHVSVEETTFVGADTIRKPLRPRNLTMDTSREPVITALTGVILDGVETSRETGTSYPSEIGATETTPESTLYNVEVYIAGVYESALSAGEQTLPYTIPFGASGITAPYNETDCEVRVYATIENPFDPAFARYVSDGYASLTFEIDVL